MITVIIIINHGTEEWLVTICTIIMLITIYHLTFMFFIVMITIDIMIYWYVPYVMPVCFYQLCLTTQFW